MSLRGSRVKESRAKSRMLLTTSHLWTAWGSSLAVCSLGATSSPLTAIWWTWGPDNPEWALQGDMQTSVTRLMELQQHHHPNCPLRGSVAGEQNTPVVFPSWCPTKLLQPHSAALSSAWLFCTFSASAGGLLCTKSFMFFRKMNINYTASGGQLQVCEVKGRDIIHQSIPHSPQSQHWWSNGQAAASSTDSTAGSSWGRHPLNSKFLGRLSQRKVEVQPVHSQAVPRSLEVQGDAGCRWCDPALGWGSDKHPAPRTSVLSRAVCKINW